jgi:hypothetical protein
MMRSLIIACLVLVALTGAAEEYDKDSALAVSQAAIGTRLQDYRLSGRSSSA